MWPLDIGTTICAVDPSVFELHSIGVAEATNVTYPRDTHTGVDLFAPNLSNNISVVSMGEGIVVGIGVGREFTTTHAVWGASVQNNDQGNELPGFSVIIRHGHLYVLYGHLVSLDNGIWVGKGVSTGTVLGTLGKFNERHLHLEVHSYGTSISGSIPSPESTMIDSTGILPVGQQGNRIIAPYHYDPLQFLPSPPGYLATNNGGLSYLDALTLVNLTLVGEEGQRNLNFGGACNRLYRTGLPGNVIKEITAGYPYRGFVGYPDYNRPLASPLTQTVSP
jgi:hypothetical protein